MKNPSIEVQHQNLEIFSSEQTQAENEHLTFQHQRRNEAANQILRKLELERNQLIQQLNQLNIEIKPDKIPPEISEMIPSTSKKVPPLQVVRSDFSFSKPFLFHVITEGQKRAFIMDAISFTENFIYNSTDSLPFEKHCTDIYSMPLSREHHDFFITYSLKDL